MNKSNFHIILLFLYLLALPTAQAQTRVSADGTEANLLGGGGSNYSKKAPTRLVGRDGLRTGQYTGEHHLIGVYIDGAYSSFINSVPVASFPPAVMVPEVVSYMNTSATISFFKSESGSVCKK